MGDWTAQAAFQIGRRATTWGEVCDFARARGPWKAFETEVREGIVLRDAGHQPPAPEVKAEAEMFRRQRKLLAAEDAEAWLSARDLTVADWQDHLARTVLRRHHSTPKGRRSVSEARELVASGWCSGAFEDMARDLAIDLLGLERWEPDDRDVAQLVERRRLDWVRVETDIALFRNSDAAREGVQCVRSDGMTLAAVAKMAKVPYRRFEGLLEDMGAGVRARLLPAVAGDVIGPVESDEGFAVYVVESKVLPTTADDDIDARARAVLRASAVDRALAESVRWHEPG